MRVYACKQIQVQTSSRSIHKPSDISQFWDFLSVFSIGSMVSGQCCFSTVNQREGQIITEYLAVVVESRIKHGACILLQAPWIKCETTHTSPDILTEKGLTPWTKARQAVLSDWTGTLNFLPNHTLMRPGSEIYCNYSDMGDWLRCWEVPEARFGFLN